MAAAFLVYRLFTVLGRRTGEERQRQNPFATGREQPRLRSNDARPDARPNDNVVAMPERARADDPVRPPPPQHSLQSGLTQIQIADPSFEAGTFAQGAKMAFGMIVEAFARGDTATLRPLVGDELYDDFSDAIRERLAAGHAIETRVERIPSADILEARMEGRTAIVTVKFVSVQVNVTRDEDGEVVDGDPDTQSEIVDIWTFSRNTRASDPNWTLVETRTPD